MRNPLYSKALTFDKVRDRGRFKTYVVFDDQSYDQGYAQIGTFASEVAQNSREEFVVDITTDDDSKVRTVELCMLGITPSNDGAWHPGRVTIELEADAD